MENYQRARSKKVYRQAHQSTMRGGKLMPVAAVPFHPGEGGVISQTIGCEMKPIAGRLVSDILMSVVQVFVPALAIDKALNPDADKAGNAEHFRSSLVAGQSMFPLGPENELTKRMAIEPIRIGGVLKTSSAVHVAHNIAVNFLRRRMYHAAAEVALTNTAVTPALLSSTVLDRFNAVLVPEDRINGSVTLEGQVPITGIGFRHSAVGTAPQGPLAMRESNRDEKVVAKAFSVEGNLSSVAGANAAVNLLIEQDPGKPGYPKIVADFGLSSGQSLSLKQFYLAEAQDKLIREFAKIMQERPYDGSKMIQRAVYGLSLDTGTQPFVVFEKTVALGAGVKSGMDGPSLDVMQTNTDAEISFTRVIPRNEFGGICITFMAIKPEEVISGQPHPGFSKEWGVVNYAADDLRIDPEPVLRRQLDSSVPAVNETDVMFWVGPNHFERQYDRYDWSRDVNTATVDHKSARWRYQVPIGVAPGNVIYPADIDHYPFQLNGPSDPACMYIVKSVAEIGSPLKLGPTPVEDMQFVDDFDLLEEEE